MPRQGRSRRDQRRLYRDLAWLWPVISPPDDYVEETEQYSRLLQGHARGPLRTLLHLGCGGGHNDHTFQRYFSVTGVDLSPAMLALARRLNPGAAYVLGDMRTLDLGQTFDAVAALDAVNYMRTEADLAAVFATAHRHLRPGGLLLTCAEETRERFQQDRAVGSTHVQDGLRVTFVEHLHDPDPRDTTYEATFVYFIRRGQRLRIETDRHLCGLFPLEAWPRLLLAASFEVKQFEYSLDEGRSCPVFLCARV